jgi:hypothetical protein
VKLCVYAVESVRREAKMEETVREERETLTLTNKGRAS